MAVNPRETKSAPVIKNVAAANVIYFDGAPVFGHNNGVIQATLTVGVLGLKPDNTCAVDVAAVAHLRCSAQAAANLRDALDKALNMMVEAAATVEKPLN